MADMACLGICTALKDKAIICYKQDKIAISLDLILKCIEINSKDFLSLNLLGLIYKKKKIYTKAIESFINAIGIVEDTVFPKDSMSW